MGTDPERQTGLIINIELNIIRGSGEAKHEPPIDSLSTTIARVPFGFYQLSIHLCVNHQHVPIYVIRLGSKQIGMALYIRRL